MHEPSELQIASLRRLARGLLYGREGAEDVVQEAWLAAVRRAPGRGELMPWLSGAVRRVAGHLRRDERHRRAREERAARHEAEPGPPELLARLELLRKLLDAVEGLEEPYRTAIGLRYLDDLPPRAIAKRLGLPVNTVRTHVRRGLERLRHELDGERGKGCEELLAALAPLAGRMPWSVPPPLPLAAAAAVVVVGSWIGLRALGRAPERSAAVPVAAEPAEGASSAPDLTLDQRQSNTRQPAGGEAPARATWVVRGHVTGGGDEPYPLVPVVGRIHAGFGLEGPLLREEHFRTDARGDFEWSVAPPDQSVTVWVRPDLAEHRVHETWKTVVRGSPPPQLLLAHAIPLDAWVSGRVVSPAGSPVADARVELGGCETKADAEGRFALRATSSWAECTVHAGAADHGQVSVRLGPLQPGEHRSLELVLARELRFAGKVIDETGAPVGAVKVTVPGYLERTTTTDAEGRFEVGGFRVGTDWVSARFEKEGFAPHYGGWKPPGERLEVDVTLARGRRVAGRVLDPHLQPVEGAEVGIGRSYSAWTISVYTDESGRFTFEHVPPEFERLEAWHERLGWSIVELDDPAVAPDLDALELVLDPGHYLAGRLLDPANEPMPWARIAANRWYISRGVRARSYLGSVVTDADGAFRFDGLPAGAVELEVALTGFARIDQEVSELDREDLVLRLEPTACVSGRVIDDDSGAAIEAFSVRVVQGDLNGMPSAWDRGRQFRDPGGTWRLDGNLRAALDFIVEVRAEGFAPSYGRVVSSTEPDPEACLVRLKTGGRVIGRVVDRATQRPIEDALVTRRSMLERAGFRIAPVVTRTDAEGRFELPDLPAETITLHVEADGDGAVDGPFEVTGTETVERWIELGTGGRISGRLLDSSGNGIAGAHVTLWGAEVVGRQRDWATTTAPDGSFEIADLPAGLFQLGWLRELEGLKSKDVQALVHLQGGEVRQIDLQPRGRATLHGTVSFTGGPLPRVVPLYLTPVPLKPGGWPDGMRGGFAVDGRFEVTNLEPGKWSIGAEAVFPDGSSIMGGGSIDVPPEGEVETHVVIEPRR